MYAGSILKRRGGEKNASHDESGFGRRLDELFGTSGDGGPIAGLERRRRDKRASGSGGKRTGPEEIPHRFWSYAARWKELEFWKGSFERFDIGRSEELRGKDFDYIRAMLRRGECFGGSECTAENWDVPFVAGGDHGGSHGWRHNELGPGVNSSSCRGGVEHGAESEQNVGQFACDLRRHLERAGRGHRKFDRVESTRCERPSALQQTIGTISTNEGDHFDRSELLEDVSF